MDEIVLSGVKPYDGRYPFESGSEFTTREWGWIKRHAGYLPASLADNDDAFSDPELVSVLAVIALHRAGRIQPSEVPAVVEKFADAPFGSTITIEIAEPDKDADADAGPPDEKPSSNEPSSGAASTTSSETSEPTRNGSGIPGSASSVSDPPMWVT